MVLTRVPKGSNEHKIMNRLYRLDTRLRGKLLLHTISMEDMIDKAIARHFCSNDEEKYLFFIYLILRDVDLRRKTGILLTILKTHYPELNRQYKILEKELPKIREMRNRLAHSFWDINAEFVRRNPLDRIALEAHKNGKEKHIEITKKDVEKTIFVTDDLVVMLDEIDDHIENKLKNK